MGGKRLLSDEQVADIMRWYHARMSFKEKALEVGVSEITLRKYVEREKDKVKKEVPWYEGDEKSTVTAGTYVVPEPLP